MPPLPLLVEDDEGGIEEDEDEDDVALEVEDAALVDVFELAAETEAAAELEAAGVALWEVLLFALCCAAAAAACLVAFAAVDALRRRLVLGGVAGASPINSAVMMLVTKSLVP